MNALLYLAVVLIWGTTWIAITLQQEGPVAIPVSIAYRFAISAAVMFVVLVLLRRLRRIAPRDHCSACCRAAACSVSTSSAFTTRRLISAAGWNR